MLVREWKELAMRSKGANGMGRCNVNVEVANNDDLALVRRGLLPPDQVRREIIPGSVDSGAAMSGPTQGRPGRAHFERTATINKRTGSASRF